KDLAVQIEAEINRQLPLLPKKDIAAVSLDKFSAIVVVDSIDEACDIANDIAPEHLELYVESPMEHMMKIKNAGAIFLGGNSPEAAGDYFAGPNHVLPTGASARFFSPLGAYDFLKRSSIIYYSAEGLAKDAPYITEMAEAEQLKAHANSVSIRIKP
ncbi:MAG: histidinol dehydrogenase, partial [Deferribacterales bacterium]|nr:histidinol dehydrogenase [Deferribacterales bacterium]